MSCFGSTFAGFLDVEDIQQIFEKRKAEEEMERVLEAREEYDL